MTVLKWPDDFKWPYAGMQSDVPPEFGRGMVRIEDQIYWLLNAIKLLNSAAVSMNTLIEAINAGDEDTLAKAKAYTDSSIDKFDSAIADLESMIDALNQNIAVTRNPVTGMHDYIYVALKQMYDFLRPYPILYSQFDEGQNGSITGCTSWNDLDALDYTWFVLDKWNGPIWNDDTTSTPVTPESRIYAMTPGYYPDVFAQGHTYDDIDTFGFVYSRTGE